MLLKKSIVAFLVFLVVAAFSVIQARSEVMYSGLAIQQQAIIPIAAFAANGDTEKLKSALEDGLSAGLSVNEIKEVLIQLYAYAGFPRSLSALNVFLDLLDTRKAAGITDKVGPAPHELPADADRRAIGTKIQTELVGRPVTGRIYEFAPAMDTFLKEHLFCDIFSRGVLSWQDRELATISVLAALPAPAQLASHLRVCRNIGMTETQLKEAAAVLKARVSETAGTLMNDLLEKMYSADRKEGN